LEYWINTKKKNELAANVRDIGDSQVSDEKRADYYERPVGIELPAPPVLWHSLINKPTNQALSIHT